MKNTRVLVALGVLAVAGVGVQRARSPFLRIEREASFAAAVAAQTGLSLDAVCALREILGADRPLEDVLRIGRRFVELRDRLGDGEALRLATEWMDADEERARGLLARRFAAMVERFASRRSAR